MNSNDILTIVGCLLLGYAVVHLVLRKPTAPQPAPQPTPAPAARAAEPPNWCRVLELAPDASVEQIREAYRRLISQYHPDKVASLGRELRELAESKSKDIAIAYQEALQDRGDAPR